MIFLNEKGILENAASHTLRKLRRDAMEILSIAVEAVDPGEAIRRNLVVDDGELRIDEVTLDLDGYSNVYVIGGGKAGGSMAEAVEELLGDRVTTGILNVLKGTESDYHLEKIRLNGASHPTPGEDGVRGVEEMLALMEGAGEGDLFIVLISGGGSSLMTYPARDTSLEEIRLLTERLLRSGATINELNAVRKHLSAVKGGLMAKRAHPASVLSLILSDVVGDPIDTIASGPTAPDQTTFEDAIRVLKSRGLWEGAPKSIRRRLEGGLSGDVEETPKEGDGIFERVHNVVVGSNLTAAQAALGRAEELGYNSQLLSTRVEGEAREVGAAFASIAKEAFTTDGPVKRPAALIAGGETTVTVTGNGVGGRNQELALGASLEIVGYDVVIAALATDGIDGPTDAAGSIVDGSTLERAERLNMDALQFLDDNDSYTFFRRLGDAFSTGPTGTNVNDLTLILVPGR
jgi:glycerate 2-kinase